jgi:hypothetical protein
MVVHILMTESDHSGLLIRTGTSRMIQMRTCGGGTILTMIQFHKHGARVG